MSQEHSESLNEETEPDWLILKPKPSKQECLCCGSENEPMLDEASYRRRFELQWDEEPLSPTAKSACNEVITPDIRKGGWGPKGLFRNFKKTDAPK